LAHEVATQLHIRLADYDGAVAEANKAVDLDPNDPDSHFAMGYALSSAGRHREAVDFFKRAMRLDPYFQDNIGHGLGMAYFFMLQLENAVNMFERAYKSNPERMLTLWFLVATYAHLGRIGEAEDALAKIREYWPRSSNMRLIYTSDFIRSKDPADLKLLADGLRKAGIPE